MAIYRMMLGDALPTGVPVQAADAARATLGGAVVAAGQLDAATGAELTRAAQMGSIAGLLRSARRDQRDRIDRGACGVRALRCAACSSAPHA